MLNLEVKTVKVITSSIEVWLLFVFKHLNLAVCLSLYIHRNE